MCFFFVLIKVSSGRRLGQATDSTMYFLLWHRLSIFSGILQFCHSSDLYLKTFLVFIIFVILWWIFQATRAKWQVHCLIGGWTPQTERWTHKRQRCQCRTFRMKGTCSTILTRVFPRREVAQIPATFPWTPLTHITTLIRPQPQPEQRCQVTGRLRVSCFTAFTIYWQHLFVILYALFHAYCHIRVLFTILPCKNKF